MLSAILTFLPAAALLVVAPGPDTLLVLRNAARGGRRAGLATAAGTVTGLLVWAAAAALGLAALVRASEVGYLVVRWAGAAYLVFLGSQLIWRSRRHPGRGEQAAPVPGAPVPGTPVPGAPVPGTPVPGTPVPGTPVRRPVAEYLTGAGTNLLNPKVGIFFISFLPAFIPRGVAVAPTALLLGAIFLTEGIVWLAVIVLLGDRLSAVVGRACVRRRMERLTGLVMIGFGVRLAFERR